ncbi:MAG: hypothetical protein R3F39_06795 [Myxococcota bacterium]
MSRFLRLVWLAQAMLLLFVGGVLAFRPLALIEKLPVDRPDLDIELAQLFAPLALGLAALTLMVLRPAFSWLRESLCTAFVASWLIGLAIALWFGAPLPIKVCIAAFAIANLAYLIRPAPSATPLSVRPSASDEAPMLGRIWAIQAFYYAVCGVLLLSSTGWVVSQLFGSQADLSGEFGTQVLHATASLYFAMALISHHAIGAQSDETWRSYCQAFLVAQWATALAMTVAILSSDLALTTWRVSVILPNALLGLVNTLTLYDRRWIRRFIALVRRSLDLWWVCQAALLAIVFAVTWIGAGWLTDEMLPGRDYPPADQRELAEDSIRLVGPLALALFGLTVMAILSRDRRSRHDFALLFVIGGGVSIACRLLDRTHIVFPDEFFFHVTTPVVLALSVVIAIANLLVWLFPDWETGDELYRGAADTKPRWVYRVCFWQTVFFALLAVAVAVWPGWLSTMLLRTDHRETGVEPLVATTLRGTAPFWAVMAATSAFTAGSAHEWSWRGLCRWFAVWQGAFVITFVYVFDSEHYEQWTLAWPTIVAALALTNASAARIPLRVNDLAGQPRPSGWLSTDLGSGLPLFGSTLFRRTRAYHRVGVGATGTFELADTPALPRTAFFAAGPERLLCTVRFSNETQPDDAALDARGCALSLSSPSSTERMDLLMATGAFGHVANAAQAMALRWTPGWLRTRWLKKSYAAREASIAMLRRAPASFAALHYHTRLVRLWVGTNADDETVGLRCRMRLIPDGDAVESGLPAPPDEDAPWNVKRLPTEARPKNYLHTELASRLNSGEARLRLQTQLGPAPRDRASSVDDAGAWYDATVGWDEADFPWHDVGTVVLTEILPPQATECLFFDPGNGGGVIATPRSATWSDERSLAEAQVRAVRMVGELRLTLYRLLGRSPEAPRGRLP